MIFPPLPVETLPQATPGAVRIRLQSLGSIFHGPDFDPFSGSFDGRSGMAHLELALNGKRGANAPDVTFVEWVVPATEASEDHVRATRTAIAGWCGAQTAGLENDLAVMARERRRAWTVGGVFFVLCFGIAAGLESSAFLSGLGGTLISETIVIAGWVGVWHPIELTLYAWWPLRRRQKLIERIARLEQRLVPDLTSGPLPQD